MLGYSIITFKQHMESQFKEGMNWNNIHVDHKIPITWFKIETPINIVNNLNNICPKFSKDNISKLNRYSDTITKEYFMLVKEWVLPQYVDKIHII